MSVPPSRLKAILLALLVTFIWSTSWVLIKIGLRELPAITFAGMRYTLAFVCLLPFLLRKKEWGQLRLFTRREWIKLVVLGIVYYALAQGAQFVGLAYLSSITVSLIINLSSLFVAVFGMVLLKEKPTWLQWSGVLLNLVGVVIYFYPSAFADGALIGILAAVVSLLANVFGSILGRNMNMNGRIRPLPLTVISMGIGAILMLLTGLRDPGFAADQPAKLGNSPAVGSGKHRIHLYHLELHPSNPDCDGIFDHQLDDDGSNRHPGMDLPGRTHRPKGNIGNCTGGRGNADCSDTTFAQTSA